MAMSDSAYDGAKPIDALPPREPYSHKGHYGTLLIVAGSLLYSGAARLCAAAAVRAGVGRVCVAVPRSAWGVVAAFDPCYMTLPLPETPTGFLSAEAWAPIKDRLSTCNALAIGPGLGQSPEIAEIVGRTLETFSGPVVLDADGLVMGAAHIDRMSSLANGAEKPWVLTPHEGEFLRIGGTLEEGRETGARAYAARTGCIVHLKGHRSITVQPDGTIAENRTGNAGLAKGGSGDLLTGLIGAFLARGAEPVKAAALGAWVLGRAGDICAGSIGQEGMTPLDVLNAIPEALRT